MIGQKDCTKNIFVSNVGIFGNLRRGIVLEYKVKKLNITQSLT
jgi:hypothetical protein